LTVYRIAQELVNNSLKHAEASMINIQLFSEPQRVCLQVTDNGKGFEYDPDRKDIKGNGLNNIRSRVNALNGRFDCWSRPGEGTETTVEFVLSLREMISSS
jgi:signal transduction histidine kinase